MTFKPGYKMTEEHKLKIGLSNSIRMKELWKNEDYKRMMSNKKKGIIPVGLANAHTPQAIEKMRQTKLRIYSNPEDCGNYKHGKSRTTEYRTMYCRTRRARKRKAEGSHSVIEWELLKKQYGNKCPCCNKKEPVITLTEDHIIPLSKGGSNFIENIQPLCKPCNSKKNVRIVTFTFTKND